MSTSPIGVLTAVPGATWEADLVAMLDRADVGLRVVRRCVDLADLLAAAAAGTASVVLLSADLRRLDREALARLAAARVGVVGLVAPHDDEAVRRLRQLGVRRVLAADVGAAIVAAAVLDVVTAVRDPEADRAWASHAFSEPAPPHVGVTEVVRGASEPEPDGRLVAVWGPTGAPGRTTTAIGLAAELAAGGSLTLLADADTYGGTVAPMLGMLDEAPGLAAAARMANQGTLELAALAKLAPTVGRDLRVLTGISRPARWTELRPSALDLVWAQCRQLAQATVVDLGFCLEQDEEISFDTAAPRRNGVALTTLGSADLVVAVGSADPVGVQRLIRGIEELRETVPGVEPVVVLNRLRGGPMGARPERQLAAALDRYAGISVVATLPFDLAATDAALREGRTLPEVAPRSALRLALRELATNVLMDAQQTTRRSGRYRRAG